MLYYSTLSPLIVAKRSPLWDLVSHLCRHLILWHRTLNDESKVSSIIDRYTDSPCQTPIFFQYRLFKSNQKESPGPNGAGGLNGIVINCFLVTSILSSLRFTTYTCRYIWCINSSTYRTLPFFFSWSFLVCNRIFYCLNFSLNIFKWFNDIGYG